MTGLPAAASSLTSFNCGSVIVRSLILPGVSQYGGSPMQAMTASTLAAAATALAMSISLSNATPSIWVTFSLPSFS